MEHLQELANLWMHEDGSRPKCYLAGPMRGYDDYNRPVFFAAAEELRLAGWEVFSPAEKDVELGITAPPGGITDKPLRAFPIGDDLKWIAESDAVFLLRGWEDSEGAALETEVAIRLGIPVYLYDDGTKITELPRKATTPVLDFGPKVRYRSATGMEKESSVYRFDLVPADALAEVARIFGMGERKYPSGPDGPNWLQGGEWWPLRASLGDHLASWDLGQDIDPSDGGYELAKIAWHALALLTYSLRGLGNDTRTKKR